MSYKANILELFRKVYERDHSMIKSWLVNWEYQVRRIKRGVKYEDELPQDYYDFKGPEELLKWINWLKPVNKPDYFDQELVNELAVKSELFDKKVDEFFELGLEFSDYKETVGKYNAQDFILANAYPMLGPKKGRKVLDFGAGYGRQVNLWSQTGDEDLCFVGMDAIPNSYCLQHCYYSQLDMPFTEYAEDPDSFKLDADSKGIYHIPTWRFDLVPDNYFDAILVVQVLPELNAKLVKHLAKEFKRVIKDTGVLYIRDHDLKWRPGHSLNNNKVLEDEGFVLEFRPHVKDDVDLHGIPRIWRKRNPDIEVHEDITVKQRLHEAWIKFDTTTNGKVKKMIKSLMGKK